MGLYDNLPLSSTEQSIRLIKLQTASNRDAPLVANISVVPLAATNPDYAAVSYCWGSPTSTKCPITCNDTVLEVGGNLAAALTSIRSMSNLPLWVDQICINQNDAQERSAQVAFMQKIYSQAKKTFIYLGELDSGAANEACEVLETIGIPVLQMSDYEKDEHKLKTRLKAGLATVKLAVQHPRLMKRAYSEDVRRALDRLIRLPYFSRKWIIQEVVMSRSLFCLLGGRCFEWDPFITAMLKQSRTVDSSADVYTATKVWWLWDLVHEFADKRRPPLLTLLYYSRSFKATEHRDYVFSLLGAASDSHEFPEPDYELSVQQVYQETSSSFVRQGNGFLLFHLAGLRPTDNGLPSWVVDWRDFDTFYSGKHFSSFCAGGMEDSITLTSTAAILQGSGKIVDRVVAVADLFNSEMNLCDRLAHYIDNCTFAFREFYGDDTEKLCIQRDLASMISFEMKLDVNDPDRTMYKFNKDYIDVSACQDICALDSLTPGQEVHMFFRFFLRKFERCISSFGPGIGVSGLSRPFQKLRPVETPKILAEDAVANGIAKDSAFENFLRYNFFKPTTRPVMTQNRRLGLAPSMTQKDDVVCVLFGANAPLILRPSAGGTYKIVGEAYVRDIMFGETLKDDRYPVQQILIS